MLLRRVILRQIECFKSVGAHRVFAVREASVRRLHPEYTIHCYNFSAIKQSAHRLRLKGQFGLYRLTVCDMQAANISYGKESIAVALDDGDEGGSEDLVVQDSPTENEELKKAMAVAVSMEVQQHKTDIGASTVSGVVMSLIKDIERFDLNAARVLKESELYSNSDLQSLTRDDLHELFPEHKKFKLRRAIFDKIHKQKPVEAVLKELKCFIPSEDFRAALTNNGALVDYLHILKDTKTCVTKMQDFLDAHIDLLEEFNKNDPNQESDKGFLSGACSSDTSGPVAIQNDQADDPQGGRVIYRIVVSGKTLNTHLRLMEKVTNQDEHKVLFVESDEDHKITVLICPVVSRIGSDVDDAMRYVKDDKPVILVLMHHVLEPKHTTAMITWSCQANIVLQANVFYHETKGLLTCHQNDDAVSKIREKLLEYRTPKCWYTSENAMDVGGTSGTAIVPWNGSSKNRDSDSVQTCEII